MRQIVCLCGSGRFFNEILQQAAELTLRGYIVLQPNFNTKGERVIRPIDKDQLDALHLDKIDMSNEVLIVCPGGYMGTSTAREMFYAKRRGKAVAFTHAQNVAVRLSEYADALRSADDYAVRELRKRGGPRVEASTVKILDMLFGSEVVETKPAVEVKPVVEEKQAAASDSVVQAAGKLHHERTLLLTYAADLLDLTESAWGVIANGPWTPSQEPKSEWTRAAEKWRERYHEVLRHPVVAQTASIRAMRTLQERVSRLLDVARSDASVESKIATVNGELQAIGDLVREVWVEPNKSA